LRALQLLSLNKVPVPRTSFLHRKQDLVKAIEEIGGAPVVIKLLEGTQGTGVVLAEDLNSAQAIVELLQFARQRLLVQKFIEEARGTDIRAFVVGNQVVAAMRRTSTNSKEFRSNVHRGGKTENIDLPETYEAAALKAAELMGLSVAGVDLLETKEGPLVLEVNSSPGLEGIEQATGVDIAGLVIQFIEDQVN
jgi:ribosomal protein S6--L-glutamate ligase